MEEELDYFEWISPLLKDIKPKLEKWFNGINSNEMDIKEKQELLNHIFWFRHKFTDKKEKQQIRDKRNPREKVNRITPSIQRIGLSILQSPGVTTKKGRELTNTLIDYFNHPEEYYPTIKKVEANLNDIRDFFKDLSISSDKKKELFTLLQS